jgi:hypothetical protein
MFSGRFGSITDVAIFHLHKYLQNLWAQFFFPYFCFTDLIIAGQTFILGRGGDIFYNRAQRWVPNMWFLNGLKVESLAIQCHQHGLNRNMFLELSSTKTNIV